MPGVRGPRSGPDRSLAGALVWIAPENDARVGFRLGFKAQGLGFRV